MLGSAFFRIPSGKDELSKRTQVVWLNVITKDRVVDKGLRPRSTKASCMFAKDILGLKKSIVVSVFFPHKQ